MEFCALRKTPEAIAVYPLELRGVCAANSILKPRSGLRQTPAAIAAMRFAV
jgi:hypothetical protein